MKEKIKEYLNEARLNLPTKQERIKNSIKPGVSVVTTTGYYGKVTKRIDEDGFYLDVSTDDDEYQEEYIYFDEIKHVVNELSEAKLRLRGSPKRNVIQLSLIDTIRWFYEECPCIYNYDELIQLIEQNFLNNAKTGQDLLKIVQYLPNELVVNWDETTNYVKSFFDRNGESESLSDDITIEWLD